MNIQLFGIKNCDSVKKARQWLADAGIDYYFHDYKTAGVPIEILQQASQQLGWAQLINQRGTTWRALSDAEKVLQHDQDYVQLVQHYPSVIKRPLLVYQGQFYLAFNATNYAEIFKDML